MIGPYDTPFAFRMALEEQRGIAETSWYSSQVHPL